MKPLYKYLNTNNCFAAGNDLTQNKRAAPPPIPQKPISLLQKSLEAPVPPDKSSFTRFGSDRKPHRPPPPVPAPGQVPVRRAHPRPGRVLSAPAGNFINNWNTFCWNLEFISSTPLYCFNIFDFLFQI
jgi:hypothetical protein